jgi:hypothetical protein
MRLMDLCTFVLGARRWRQRQRGLPVFMRSGPIIFVQFIPLAFQFRYHSSSQLPRPTCPPPLLKTRAPIIHGNDLS